MLVMQYSVLVCSLSSSSLRGSDCLNRGAVSFFQLSLNSFARGRGVRVRLGPGLARRVSVSLRCEIPLIHRQGRSRKLQFCNVRSSVRAFRIAFVESIR